MGFLRQLASGKPDPVLLPKPTLVQFTGASGVDIDPALLYGSVTPTQVPIPARVSRREAMSVPAVKRARDLIAGTLGALPVEMIGPDHTKSDWSLLDQPERGVPRSVTMTQTFEDLLFEGVAWWYVTETTWNGYPAFVRRLDPRSVSVRQDLKVYVTALQNSGSAAEWVPDDRLIRFDSPNDPLLVSGARAIRACIALDDAALRYSQGNQPLDFFTPAEGVDPGDEEAIPDVLTDWQTARRNGVTAYIPAALKYNSAGWNPEQLQLASARDHAVLEIARLTGVEAEELGVSTTSRTYYNAFDRRKSFVDFTLGGYRQAAEDRLSMGDLTPRGYVARFDLDSFMRSDPLSRYQAYQAGLAAGALTEPEIREAEGRPALTGPIAAVPNNQEAANA